MIQCTRIKICGITSVQDAADAVALGVHALGLICYRPSSRYVSLPQAHKIAKHLPPFVSLVGVFVNPEFNEVRQILQTLPLNILQFHGDESVEFCEACAMPYIKAIRMQPTTNLQYYASTYASAQALLLDSYHPAQQGGTGTVFNWEWIPPSLSLPIILSGGLTAANVATAIAAVKPYAVDVSSGVEDSVGIKNLVKMRAFVAAVS